MSDITLLQLIESAMDAHGADGLWNAEGPCGCGRNDLAPCGGMQAACTLATSRMVAEGEADDINDVGDTVWFPMRIGSAAC